MRGSGGRRGALGDAAGALDLCSAHGAYTGLFRFGWFILGPQAAMEELYVQERNGTERLAVAAERYAWGGLLLTTY